MLRSNIQGRAFLPNLKDGASCPKIGEGIHIGIETHPDFRNKGLATAIAAKLLVHCIERGVYPHWSASSENAASIHLAEKLGYVHDTVYETLGVP